MNIPCNCHVLQLVKPYYDSLNLLVVAMPLLLLPWLLLLLPAVTPPVTQSSNPSTGQSCSKQASSEELPPAFA
jgi:hypothetical protein